MPHDRQWFIERMGRFAEADGLPRIAGRLFAALLASEEPRSLDELADEIGASKASVSTDARRLLERGVVERQGRRGDRRDYYQLAPDFFTALVRHRLDRWSQLREHVEEMERSTPRTARAVRERFDYIDQANEHLLGRMYAALDAWESDQRARRSAQRRSAQRPPARARTAARSASSD